MLYRFNVTQKIFKMNWLSLIPLYVPYVINSKWRINHRSRLRVEFCILDTLFEFYLIIKK